MSRLLLLAVLGLVGCGAEEPGVSSSSLSTGATSGSSTQETSSETSTELTPRMPGDWMPAPAIPRGEPLEAGDLDGIFPPKWRVGATWRVLTAREEPSFVPFRGPPFAHMDWREYQLRVVAAPGKGAVDEYRVDVVQQRNSDERYVLVFSAEDRALLKVIPKLPKGQRPDRDDVEVTSRGPFLGHRPIRAFPAFPPQLENPLLVQEPRDHYARLAWQVIEPRKQALLFEVGEITFQQGPDYSRRSVRMEWRRGEPWWSVVTEPFRDEDTPKEISGVELVDGRIVLGRLVRPGEATPPRTCHGCDWDSPKEP